MKKDRILKLAIISILTLTALSSLTAQQGITEVDRDLTRPSVVQGSKPTQSTLTKPVIIKKATGGGSISLNVAPEMSKRLQALADREDTKYLAQIQSRNQERMASLELEFTDELKRAQKLFQSDQRYAQLKKEYDALSGLFKNAKDDETHDKLKKKMERFMNRNREAFEELAGDIGLKASRIEKWAARNIDDATVKSIDLGVLLLETIREAFIPSPGRRADSSDCFSPPYNLDPEKKDDPQLAGIILSNKVWPNNGHILQDSFVTTLPGGTSVDAKFKHEFNVPTGYSKIRVSATLNHDYDFTILSLGGFGLADGEAYLRVVGYADEDELISQKRYPLDGAWGVIVWFGESTFSGSRTLVTELPVSRNGGSYIVHAGVATWTLATPYVLSAAEYDGNVEQICIELIE